MDYIYHYSSPLGRITMASDGKALTGLWFEGQKYFADTLSSEHEEKYLDIFNDTTNWLDTYFGGNDPGFTPALSIDATPFRRNVWEILLTIPYGHTTTYGKIAAQISSANSWSPMSAQAVGGAVGHNPIALIIPCHRVLGADGSLTGYAGGLGIKSELLKLEGIL